MYFRFSPCTTVVLFMCLTGSDWSAGVMKPPKPNLTPKPPIRIYLFMQTDYKKEKKKLQFLSCDLNSHEWNQTTAAVVRLPVCSEMKALLSLVLVVSGEGRSAAEGAGSGSRSNQCHSAAPGSGTRLSSQSAASYWSPDRVLCEWSFFPLSTTRGQTPPVVAVMANTLWWLPWWMAITMYFLF